MRTYSDAPFFQLASDLCREHPDDYAEASQPTSVAFPLGRSILLPTIPAGGDQAHPHSTVHFPPKARRKLFCTGYGQRHFLAWCGRHRSRSLTGTSSSTNFCLFSCTAMPASIVSAPVPSNRKGWFIGKIVYSSRATLNSEHYSAPLDRRWQHCLERQAPIFADICGIPSSAIFDHSTLYLFDNTTYYFPRAQQWLGLFTAFMYTQKSRKAAPTER